MKLASFLASALAVACATTGLTIVIAHEVTGLKEANLSPVVGQEVKMTPALRRHLQTGSGTTDAPTSTPTTTPTPTTATPATTSPTPTTATPTTTAPTPTTPTPTTTTATPTATTETPDATTATPDATTATPDGTTATPEATTTTPEATTETPTTPTATSTASSTSTDTTTSTPSATESVTSNSGSASSASADTSSGSSMSTGAVIGIVVGIVAAVAIVATIIMCVIRRRRDAEDDPLSPFELSVDKGYNPTPGNFTAQNSYNPRAVGAGASASGSMNRTPQADAVAAGVAYSQFYDNAATSPGSMNRLESNVDSVQTDPGNNAPATNGTNLWLSAMEPKDNDSYLSAHESPRSSRNSSHNSYDFSSNQNVDVDQSSQISGNSNKESDDFPDHHEDNDSARGSYEL